MDIHCHSEAAGNPQDWRTPDSTCARRRGALPQVDATAATSAPVPYIGAELRALEILTPSLLGQALAGRTEAESLAFKADLIRQAGYVSADAPFDTDEALCEAAAWRLTELLAAASDAEANLRRRR